MAFLKPELFKHLYTQLSRKKRTASAPVSNQKGTIDELQAERLNTGIPYAMFAEYFTDYTVKDKAVTECAVITCFKGLTR